MRNKTFAGIDYFRLIAAFMVIAIHTSPLSVWNEGIDFLITYCVGRIAVPFFFMTTGYFVLAPYVLSNFKKKSPIHKYLVKNIRLYLIVTAIYIPISVYSGNMPHSIMELMKQLLFDEIVYQYKGEYIMLHAQIQAQQFYEKQGDLPYGEIEYEENCPHIWMLK